MKTENKQEHYACLWLVFLLLCWFVTLATASRWSKIRLLCAEYQGSPLPLTAWSVRMVSVGCTAVLPGVVSLRILPVCSLFCLPPGALVPGSPASLFHFANLQNELLGIRMYDKPSPPGPYQMREEIDSLLPSSLFSSPLPGGVLSILGHVPLLWASS